MYSFLYIINYNFTSIFDSIMRKNLMIFIQNFHRIMLIHLIINHLLISRNLKQLTKNIFQSLNSSILRELFIQRILTQQRTSSNHNFKFKHDIFRHRYPLLIHLQIRRFLLFIRISKLFK